jgi:LPXTG-motif cell wall-anchored protein
MTRINGAIACTIALLTMRAGGAQAAIPSTSSYLYSTQPMISGTVLWVNEHQLAVATEQGEDILLALDSHSMVPVDLAPGMVMRAEFHVMDDGRRYARRIVPIRGGMSATRELAYSQERASDPVVAEYASTSDGEGGENDPSQASSALSSTNQPLETSLAATPSTHAYQVAMQPMIVGRVVTVNDHRIVVDTDQGQRVALEMDSRTLIPTNLASDMTVSIDYKAMENGPKYARRITLTRNAPASSSAFSYESAPEPQEEVAQNAVAETQMVMSEPASMSEATSGEPESLPQTAGTQPLIALLGFLALGAAGALAIGRRRQPA